MVLVELLIRQKPPPEPYKTKLGFTTIHASVTWFSTNMNQQILPSLILVTAFVSVCGAQEVSRQPESKNGLVVEAGSFAQTSLPKSWHRIGFAQMQNNMGQISLAMLATPVARDDPTLLRVSEKSADSATIKKNSKVAERRGLALEIRTTAGAVFRFTDVSHAGTPESEPQSVTFRYSGPVRGTKFHKIDQFDAHGEASSFLVAADRKVAVHVQPTSDTVSFSPQGNRLLVMSNGLNSPYFISVANVATGTLQPEITCQAEINFDRQIVPVFKGWHVGDRLGFDLLMIITASKREDTPSYQAHAIRLKFENGKWAAEASNPPDLLLNSGLSCWTRDQ